MAPRWSGRRSDGFGCAVCRTALVYREKHAMPSFTLNGAATSVDGPADMPLLWALRDVVGATGTKFGCGVGACGACTVHLDGEATRSCLTPMSAAEGKQVDTIESMERDPVGQ